MGRQEMNEYENKLKEILYVNNIVHHEVGGGLTVSISRAVIDQYQCYIYGAGKDMQCQKKEVMGNERRRI